ncbi:hypothetical protein Tco_0788032 [Tanacetum coccineum]
MVYEEDIEKDLDLWSSKEYVKFAEETELVFHNTFNLLYRFTDLLSLKVYNKKDLHSKDFTELDGDMPMEHRICSMEKSKSLSLEASD